MKLSLSKNISELRKANSMTQEQLAEALGVTFAAVSKWERGVATPELNLIAEMSDLFGVSLDALVGFKVQDGSADALEQRIHDLQCEKRSEDSVIAAEKAILKYPNDFRIVYRAGIAYEMAGLELKNEKYIHRSMELLEHSILLLSQNTDPEISEVTIQNEIAQGHIILGQTDKGLEILKKYNVCGVHDPLIALTYSTGDRYDPKDATPYLMQAFNNILLATIRTMLSYANYYAKLEDYESCLEAILWLINILESVKVDANAIAFVDKLLAPCYSECANLSFCIGWHNDVEPYLRKAYSIAKAFDAAPNYKVDNIKFCVGDVSKATIYDDIGGSAKSAIENQITQENRNEILYKIWQHIIEEDEGIGEL